ncbi:MAG: hypothetical protein ACR2JC_16300 [Chloroflexota bacterium]
MPDQQIPSRHLVNPEERFAALVDALAAEPGVTAPGESGRREFGSSALKVNGSIFAMLTRGLLVVKLPRDRVNASIQDGIGDPFDAGKGTPMKEWLTVAGDEDTWLTLAREALDFVGRPPRRS